LQVAVKRLIAFSVVLVLVLFALPLFFSGNVSPAEITHSRMVFDRLCILEYARANNKLPPNLSDLPRLAFKPEPDRYLEDAWHRQLIYEIDSSGMVTLRSLGKSGVPGGSGENAEIVLKFPPRRADGSWSRDSDP
jgi:hypothetical protein